MGKPKDPDYWKKWRAAHPEYMARERLRSQGRDRKTEKAKAAARSEQDERNRRREADEVRRWRARNPDKRKAQKQRNYRRHREDKLKKSVDNKRKRAASKLLSSAHRITEQIVRPDRRSVIYDSLYEDALAEAVLMLCIYKSRSVAFREAAALQAVETFVETERLYRWYTRSDVDVDTQTRRARSP